MPQVNLQETLKSFFERKSPQLEEVKKSLKSALNYNLVKMTMFRDEYEKVMNSDKAKAEELLKYIDHYAYKAISLFKAYKDNIKYLKTNLDLSQFKNINSNYELNILFNNGQYRLVKWADIMHKKAYSRYYELLTIYDLDIYQTSFIKNLIFESSIKDKNLIYAL